MAATEAHTQAKPPIRLVLFVGPNGGVMSWSRAEIRANPELFGKVCAAEAERGVRPLVMRGHTQSEDA